MRETTHCSVDCTDYTQTVQKDLCMRLFISVLFAQLALG